MESKKCIRCECVKNIELFPWKSKKENKRRPRCIDCHNFLKRQHRAKLRKEKGPRQPKEKIVYSHTFCSVCEETKPTEAFYPSHGGRKRGRCIECLKVISAKRHKETYEEKKQYYADYYQKNNEYRKGWQSQYRKTERGKETRKRSKKQYESRPEQRITKAQKRRIKTALNRKNLNKCTTTLKYIGCTAKELKHHLESQFKEGMTWENYGYEGWHIDHIKPISSFDLSDTDQQLECFNHKNLQPLWAEENLSKGAKFE
tara:strand:- start:59 stop:832 length:774 start_codon:yes stop_codon:yes gene_type:complete